MAPTDDQPPPPQEADSSSTSPNTDAELRRPRRPRPRHDFPETQAGKLWKALENPSGGPVNEMPGGTYNTAGGKPKEPTWRDAFRFDQFSSKHNPNRPWFFQQQCARDALLVGICAGGGIGGLRFILRGLSGMLLTTNYAVGGFTATSLGMFYWCQRRRQEEARGMAAAVAGMKMLHEKRAREDAERKRLAEEQRRKDEEERIKSKRWWKPWS